MARSLGTRRFQAASDASIRSRSSPNRCLASCGPHLVAAERRDDVEAEIPGLPGLELDPEPDLPRLDVPALGQDHLRSREPGVVVEDELVLVLLVAPFGRRWKWDRLDRVTEGEVVVLDREDVREVAAELERELERDVLLALVLDAQVVLHALPDEPVPPDRDGVLEELAGGRIAEEVGGGVVLGLSRREEERALAVDRQLEVGQEARVIGVEAARREREVAVLVADAEIRPLEDRYCHQSRMILDAVDCASALTTSSSTLTWFGRVTANRMHSAMSSGVSGSTPS